MCNRYIAPSISDIEIFWELAAPTQAGAPSKELFPRAQGPFIRNSGHGDRELVVGQWGLIPHFATSPVLKYSTNNARSEELTHKASYRDPWRNGQRCIIPSTSFDEPCWETGKSQWWRFHRSDGNPFGLAGLWNIWVDKTTGECFPSFTMLTLNADAHPIMGRMHKPDPKCSPDQQDKRSVVVIEKEDVDQWLFGTHQDASQLVRLSGEEVFKAGPLTV